jgi:hypothetical protein
MSIINEDGVKVEAVSVPPEAVEAAYKAALRSAEKYAKCCPGHSDKFTDAATDSVLWSIDHCTDAEKFRTFAASACRRWLYRTSHKLRMKDEKRPAVASLEGDVATTRTQSPTGIKLIQDLPEDLAWIVSLYMDQGFNCREIALLTGQGHNTVNLKLKRAAEILAEGRIKPERRKNEKRLTPG